MNDIVAATGLAQGVLIQARVMALNVQGSSDSSPINTSGVLVKVKPQAPTTQAERGPSTSTTAIQVLFGPISDSLNGGSAATFYILERFNGLTWVQAAQETATTSASSVTLTSSDMTIISGVTYSFRWKAVNIYGTSDSSPTVGILAATVPDAPATAEVTVSDSGNVKVSWTEPINTGGASVAITDYIVKIVTSTGSYVEDTSLCDGSSSTSMSTLSCEFSFLPLVESPFNLVQGNTIKVQILVKNSIGWGQELEVTDGITVMTIPETPPTSPTEGSNSNNVQIEIIIDALTGTNTGGSDILEYDIFWNQGSIINTWDLLITLPATGSSFQSHIQTAGISEGLTYQFKYAARNFLGTSLDSATTSILAATVPAQVAQPTRGLSSTNVVISWLMPDARGSVITKYKVTFLDKSDSTYKEVESF